MSGDLILQACLKFTLSIDFLPPFLFPTLLHSLAISEYSHFLSMEDWIHRCWSPSVKWVFLLNFIHILSWTLNHAQISIIPNSKQMLSNNCFKNSLEDSKKVCAYKYVVHIYICVCVCSCIITGVQGDRTWRCRRLTIVCWPRFLSLLVPQSFRTKETHRGLH